jgi:hypothetical protein
VKIAYVENGRRPRWTLINGVGAMATGRRPIRGSLATCRQVRSIIALLWGESCKRQRAGSMVLPKFGFFCYQSRINRGITITGPNYSRPQGSLGDREAANYVGDEIVRNLKGDIQSGAIYVIHSVTKRRRIDGDLPPTERLPWPGRRPVLTLRHHPESG